MEPARARWLLQWTDLIRISPIVRPAKPWRPGQRRHPSQLIFGWRWPENARFFVLDWQASRKSWRRVPITRDLAFELTETLSSWALYRYTWAAVSTMETERVTLPAPLTALGVLHSVLGCMVEGFLGTSSAEERLRLAVAVGRLLRPHVTHMESLADRVATLADAVWPHPDCARALDEPQFARLQALLANDEPVPPPAQAAPPAFQRPQPEPAQFPDRSVTLAATGAVETVAEQHGERTVWHVYVDAGSGSRVRLATFSRQYDAEAFVATLRVADRLWLPGPP